MTQADVAVLGAGPGGYVAALRAAQLGARVVLVEENGVGGVCLNVGCIPTKALLRSAELYRAFLRAEDFGLRLQGDVTPDWPAIQERKQAVVKRLVKGVETLLRKAKVQVLHGRGRLVPPLALEVAIAGDVQRFEAKSVIVATGSRPVQLPLPGMGPAAGSGQALPGVIDSTGALALGELPRRLLVVGGGVVGVEFADIFGAFGVEVTIVEMLERLLPQMDADLGLALARLLGKRGISIHLGSRVTRVDAVAGGLRATVATPQGDVAVEADRVLVAVGRRPNVEEVGLEAVGVRFDERGIPVDAQMRTNVPGVYAVGDVTGGALLAHVAMRQGEVAAENALGRTSAFDSKTTPYCVYTDPEVASVGLTEAQARQGGYDVRVGRFPLRVNGKALTYGQREGFVKVVSEARFDEVLGLHIVGPHASDLIHEGALALALEVTLDELVATTHAHPTLGEAVREAALDARGEALHLA